MSNEFIGRKVAVGLGIEGVRGVVANPQYWVAHMSLDMDDAQDNIENESALGVVEKTNDSLPGKRWAEGSLEGKVRNDSMGVVLLGVFGEVTTAANADASGDVYDHTFAISQENAGQTLTLWKKDPIVSERYALATLGELELTVEAGGFAMFNASILSKPSVDGSATVAYTEEAEYTSKHATFKHAANVAGLGAASPVKVSQASVKVTRNTTDYQALGAVEIDEVFSTEVEIEGSATLNFTSEAYKDFRNAQTEQAIQLALVNTDVTIGTAANPRLILTLNKATITEWSRDNSLGDIVTQEITFKGHFDIGDGQAIEAVLTNEVETYEAES